MRDCLLSWTIGARGHVRGGRKDKATWADVEPILGEVLERSGTVTVDLTADPELGSGNLQVRTEDGLSIITLGVDNGEDYVVRSYSGGKRSSGNVEILGDYWPSESICSDFKVVVGAFKEFLENGDVSKEVLS